MKICRWFHLIVTGSSLIQQRKSLKKLKHLVQASEEHNTTIAQFNKKFKESHAFLCYLYIFHMIPVVASIRLGGSASLVLYQEYSQLRHLGYLEHWVFVPPSKLEKFFR